MRVVVPPLSAGGRGRGVSLRESTISRAAASAIAATATNTRRVAHFRVLTDGCHYGGGPAPSPLTLARRSPSASVPGRRAWALASTTLRTHPPRSDERKATEYASDVVCDRPHWRCRRWRGRAHYGAFSPRSAVSHRRCSAWDPDGATVETWKPIALAHPRPPPPFRKRSGCRSRNKPLVGQASPSISSTELPAGSRTYSERPP